MSEPRIEYKIVLIGNTAVGKTSLFKKLTTGVFSERNISTIGMDKKTMTLEIEVNKDNETIKKKVNISFIDTAGQERFRAITKLYFKESDGILLLYDITNRESFKNVGTWIETIHESIGNHSDSKYVIILIGNKLDLIGVDGKVREVEEEEGKEICEEKGLIWGGECSVKTIEMDDLKNKFTGYVKLIYEKVGEKIVTKQFVNKISGNKMKTQKKAFC